MISRLSLCPDSAEIDPASGATRELPDELWSKILACVALSVDVWLEFSEVRPFALVSKRWCSYVYAAVVSLQATPRLTDERLRRFVSLVNLSFSTFAPAPSGDDFLVTDEGLKGLRSLCFLYKPPTTISDASISCLTQLAFLSLRADHASITNDSIRLLTNLTALEMHGNRHITDESFTCLSNLTRLVRYQCAGLTDVGLQPLTNLAELQLDEDLISDAGLSLLTNLMQLSISQKSSARITDGTITGMTQL
jgi:hypothetical protein